MDPLLNVCISFHDTRSQISLNYIKQTILHYPRAKFAPCGQALGKHVIYRTFFVLSHNFVLNNIILLFTPWLGSLAFHMPNNVYRHLFKDRMKFNYICPALDSKV